MVGSHSGAGSRLSGMESMEEAGRWEEEVEEEEEEITIGEGLGFSALLALGGRRSLLWRRADSGEIK